MTAGWVAAATRGRSLLRRTIGPDGARELASAESWPEARQLLASTPYGSELSPDADRLDARHIVATTYVWQLRVLAGWLPPGASRLARQFAAPVEIANIEHHLTRISGGRTAPSVALGSLAVAWPRVAASLSVARVREVLASSVWGDPGGADQVAMAVGLRVAWARRLARQVPDAAAWALGFAAVLVARERFAFDRAIAEGTSRELDRLIGTRWRNASTIAELHDRLPPSAAWALDDCDERSHLWRSELALMQRLHTDSSRLAGSGRYDQSSVVAVMALLLSDWWRVHAALELAGRGPAALEVFDAVA